MRRAPGSLSACLHVRALALAVALARRALAGRPRSPAALEARTARLRPSSVVRLVRVDPGGAESLLEAEQRPGGPGPRRARRLSRLQAEGLRAHQETAALLQLSQGGPADAASTLERASAVHRAVVPLKQLSSQYVGPVGIGTQTFPEGCSGKAQALLSVDAAEGGRSHDGAAACQARPQSTMQLIHDTGSTNLWLFSKECQDPPCIDKRRTVYDKTKSTSFSQLPDTAPTTITFGTGKIIGNFGKEDFHFPHYSVRGQQFGMIKHVEGTVFEQPDIGGILGLSFREMSANGATPLFDNVMQQGVLAKNSFAFYMSPDSPSANALFWGPVDERFLSEPMRYFHVSDPYYWSVDMEHFRIGNETLLSARGSSFLEGRAVAPGRLTPKAIFDSGTTYFTAGGGLFDRIMARLPAAPCDEMTPASHPEIAFRLADTAGSARDFVFDHNEYMVRSGDGGGECRPAFMKINVPEEHNGPSMLLGQTFNLKHVVEYDRGDGDSRHARVGVALARHGPDQEAALRAATASEALAGAATAGATKLTASVGRAVADIARHSQRMAAAAAA